MADNTEDSYIEDVRMESADNGVTIRYTERCKRKGKGTYDAGYDYNERKLVFNFDESKEKGESDSGEEEMNEAFDKFKELFMQAHKDRAKKKGY